MTLTTALILLAFIVGVIVICKFILTNSAKILLIVILCLACLCTWHWFIAKDGRTPDEIGTEFVNKAGNAFDKAADKVENFVDSQPKGIVKSPTIR